MNVRPMYTAEFFRGEIQRTIELLAQGISPEQRVFYQNKLAIAREYLADLERYEKK